MKKRLTNNWLLKIASLVFAFCLWLIVMNVENPTMPQTFSNIKVEFVNTEVLTDQGLIYDILDDTNVVKSITVYGPRNTVEQLKSEDIIAKADFNNLTNVNTIPIDFSTSRFGTEITDIRGSISTVKLNVEKEKTIRLPLRVNAVGEPAEGYLLGSITPDQNQITVTGAESVINMIDKAVAEVDVNEATAGIATYADVKLYNEEGVLVESNVLTQKVTSVRVAVEILATKNVPLVYSVMGTPAAGYLATGEIVSDPQMVLIAGPANILNNVNRIEIPAEELNITGQSENMLATVNIKEFLPSNVILADSNFNGKASVTVYIGEMVSKIFRIHQSQLMILGVPEGYEAVLEGIDVETEVEFKGLSAELSLLNEAEIIGYVDLQDVMEEEGIEEWEEGTYRTTVQFDFQKEIVTGQDLLVDIILKKLEE